MRVSHVYQSVHIDTYTLLHVCWGSNDSSDEGDHGNDDSGEFHLVIERI